jgi:hypothetical protein
MKMAKDKRMIELLIVGHTTTASKEALTAAVMRLNQNKVVGLGRGIDFEFAGKSDAVGMSVLHPEHSVPNDVSYDRFLKMFDSYKEGMTSNPPGVILFDEYDLTLLKDQDDKSGE